MLTLSLDGLSSSCILCAQCWQCLSIVCLQPVSCVPNVDIVSRLFIFILYLVYPMLTVSLDCLSSSCILCPQCWHCLSIVYLHPVSCVPNVDSVSRLFVFILYLVYPTLTVSLDYLSSSCILCAQCWHCLSSVYLHPVSCVPNVDIVSRLFIFILYLVYPMLTVSLDCLSSSCILCTQCWQCLSIVYLHPVSCVPNVDIVSRLFIFILYLVCPMLTVSVECLSSSCILCTQCWHCLSIVYLQRQCQHWVHKIQDEDKQSILYLVCPMLTVSLDCLSSSCILCTQCWQCLSIVYLHSVSFVPNVDIVSRLFIFRDTLSSSCILCTQCWHCLSIVYLQRHFIFILYLVCLMLTVSLECLSSSCILCPNVDSVSRWFVFILYLVCPMLTVSLDCFSSSCILCTQCWHCLPIVYLHPVSCVPNVDSVSRLFIFILYLVCPMLTLSLDCLSSDNANIGYTRYRMKKNNRETLYLHPVSCVPNVDIVSRVFIYIPYLVCPMLTVSLDCLSSSCILCTQCWQCLSIVYLHPVSCVPNVDSVSRVFIFIMYLVYPMLTVSLDCLSSSCILCA